VRILFGDFALDRGSRQLLRAGEDVRLGPKTLDLLDLLLSQQPRALSKSHIRDRLWPRTFVADSNLTSLVTELRTALGDDARRPRFIRTVYGFGYAFCGTVQDDAEKAASSPARSGLLRLLYQGRVVVLEEGENLLGRAGEAVAGIDSPTVSRRHARVLVSDGKATLEDLGSRNGTYLRGERIKVPSALLDGDEIRIGRVFITFRSFPEAGPTETEADL